MKEGLNTKKKLDTVTGAVVAGGVIGAVGFIALHSEGRSLLRHIAGGAIVGAAFGAIRGATKANSRFSQAEIEGATNFPESQGEDQEGRKKANLFANLTKNIKGLNKAKLEELRERKSARDIIEGLQESIDEYSNSNTAGIKNSSLTKIKNEYVDTIARSRCSSKNSIDLIKYKKDSKDRNELEAILQKAKIILDQNSEEGIGDLERQIKESMKHYDDKNEEVEKLRRNYIIRNIAADAVIGAAIGSTAGFVISKLGEHVLMPLLQGHNPVSFIHNVSTDSTSPAEAAASTTSGEVTTDEKPVGGASLSAKIQALIGRKIVDSSAPAENFTLRPDGSYNVDLPSGNNIRVEYDTDGSITEHAKSVLEQQGYQVHDIEQPFTLPEGEGATTPINTEAFFDPSNQDTYGLSHIEGIRYIEDNEPNPYNLSQGVESYGPDAQVQISAGEPGLDYSNMRIVFSQTPETVGYEPNNYMGVEMEISPDGKVIIDENSPAKDFFDENGALKEGFRYQLVRDNGDGTNTIYESEIGKSTLGDNTAIRVPNPNPEGTIHSTIITDQEGNNYNITPLNGYKQGVFQAFNGVSAEHLSSGESTTELSGDTISMTNESGETVEIHKVIHHGGYDQTDDGFYGPKIGQDNLGQSLARTMLTEDEMNGQSAEGIERLFLEKIERGEYSTDEVLEKYLGELAKNPESMVLRRALLDDNFYIDTNGDGVMNMQDINEYANQLASSSPAEYDRFVNDTIDMFMNKAAGKKIEFFNYEDPGEQYNMSTWAKNEGGDSRLYTGHILHPNEHRYYGVGIRITDENGNSIYSANAIQRFYGNVDPKHFAERTTCRGQFTGTEVSQAPAPAAAQNITDHNPAYNPEQSSPANSGPSSSGGTTPPSDNSTPPSDDSTQPPITEEDEIPEEGETPEEETPEEETPEEETGHTPKDESAEIKNDSPYSDIRTVNGETVTELSEDEENFDAVGKQLGLGGSGDTDDTSDTETFDTQAELQDQASQNLENNPLAQPPASPEAINQANQASGAAGAGATETQTQNATDTTQVIQGQQAAQANQGAANAAAKAAAPAADSYTNAPAADRVALGTAGSTGTSGGTSSASGTPAGTADTSGTSGTGGTSSGTAGAAEGETQ